MLTNNEIKSFIQTSNRLPKISVIMPSYNQKDFIERSILSVVNQGYSNYELIIIDGGSTDGAVDIIRKYERYITFWVSEKDNGQSHAFNKGAQIATGDFIGWQNSDDIYLPGAFYSFAKAYLNNPDHDVFFSNMILLNDRDEIVTDVRYVPFSQSSLLYEGWNITNQSTFWKKSLFDEIGCFDETKSYGMDYDWFVRLSSYTNKFLFVRDFWGAFRVYQGTKSSTISSTIGVREYGEIRRKHIPNFRPSQVRKLYSVTRRFLYYFLQGDLDYILRGLVRNIGIAKPKNRD